MNTLDIARALIVRTWKPLGITVAALALLTLSLVFTGIGSTVVLLAFVGLFALIYFKGVEIYFGIVKHLSIFATKAKNTYEANAKKVLEWWTPIWDDITGEAKAVSDARATLNSAKATRKDASKELKTSRKAVKSNAKTAAKALQAQLIAAGNGDDVNDLTVETLNARKAADASVSVARSAKRALDSAVKAVEIAKDDFDHAVETYRNSKSEALAS